MSSFVYLNEGINKKIDLRTSNSLESLGRAGKMAQ